MACRALLQIISKKRRQAEERGFFMTRSRKISILIPFVLFLTLFILAVSAESVHAAYQKIPTDGTVIKAGGYYFKSAYAADGFIQMSEQKDSGYEYVSSGLSGSCWTDGTYIIGVSRLADGNQAFSKYNIKAGKMKRLKKKLPNKKLGDEYDYYDLAHVYGNYAYITRSSFRQWTFWTYVYNLKTGKFKKVKDKCGISFGKGKYMLGANEYQTDVSAHKKTLYKVGKGGSLKKVKVLGKYIGTCELIGKKIYYQSCTSTAMKKCTLYSIGVNGKGKKKLGSFKAYGQYGQVNCYNFTSKYCYVSGIKKDYGTYKYVYKTKKLKKVS